MGTRKFRADYLFTGGELLSTDKVLITDDSGIIKEITTVDEAGDNIEFFEGLISPGFVNTHCHLELSHMKSRIPPGTGLVEFLSRVIKERNFPAEEMMDAMLSAADEMYDTGIVAVGDICNTANSTAVKQDSRINWFNFIEVIGLNEQDATGRMAYATSIADQFKKSSPYNSSISPHAPYSVSEKLFGLINEVSSGRLITIHNQEAEAENELYLNKSGLMLQLFQNLNIDPALFKASGKSSLQTYLPWLNKVAGVLLVHNVYTSDEDLDLMTEIFPAENTFLSICIGANRYIQSINPPIDRFKKHHCNITLGTDSYASNHQLNILEEIKLIHKEFPALALSEMLTWATSNGATALGMANTLGSFEKGKQPGIVWIDKIRDQQVSGDSSSSRIL